MSFLFFFHKQESQRALQQLQQQLDNQSHLLQLQQQQQQQQQHQHQQQLQQQQLQFDTQISKVWTAFEQQQQQARVRQTKMVIFFFFFFFENLYENNPNVNKLFMLRVVDISNLVVIVALFVYVKLNVLFFPFFCHRRSSNNKMRRSPKSCVS